VAVALLGLAALGAVGVRSTLRARAQLCSGAATQLADVWGAAQAERLTRAAQGQAQPLQSAAGVRAALDAYGAQWTQMRTQACEATRLRGEQSEALLDLRMACLDRRLQEMGALAAAIDGPKALRAAGQGVQQLTPLSLCANAQALQAVGPPPADAAVRKQVEALQLRVSQLEARRLVGDAGGLAQSREIVAAAQELGHKPLVAEAFFGLGMLEELASDRAQARRAMGEAAAAALGARDDATATRAFTRLLRIDNYDGHFEEARLWGSLAAGSIERLGGDDALEMALAAEGARLDRREGKLESALAQLLRVLERARRIQRTPAELTAGALYDLSKITRELGRLDDALRYAREALQILRPLLGEHHLHTIIAHSELGLVLNARRELPEAEAELRLGLQGSEALLGHDHPNVADHLIYLGQNLELQGRLPEALAAARGALEIYRQKLGAQHARVLYGELLLGRLLWATGDAKAAVPLLEHALGAAGTASGPITRADVQIALARALWDAGLDRRRARALGEEARATYAAHAAKNPHRINQEALAQTEQALASMR
jgi:tetratricopeptide (TPR) repeat protein